MTVSRKPVAFLSYVRDDDKHDAGRITKLRERLEGEVQMQTGRPFPIFQDRNDLEWGQQWEERINTSLTDVTFLIPIITPSFFHSPSCREEFNSFLLREETLGFNKLVLPIHYVTTDQLLPEFPFDKDAMADSLRARQWTDWRTLRFKDLATEEPAQALATLASMVKNSIADLAVVLTAESAAENAAEARASSDALQPAPEKLSQRPTRRPQVSRPERSEIIIKNKPLKGSASDLIVTEIAPGKDGKTPHPSLFSHRYYVYTKQFDEVVLANNLAEVDEIFTLNRMVLQTSDSLEEKNEEKLTILKKDLLSSINQDCVIEILIDNSGSLRGQPIHAMAAWLQVILPIIEFAGIKTEISGFTTRAWKGGRARELWLQNGRPKSPGRLNDLRYIIYKSFDENFRDAAANISISTKEGILKENIDGEALIWASDRLKSRHEGKKILLILSDGAPVDDSTLAENAHGFLWNHAARVASYLKESSECIVRAIGIDYDVKSIYGPNSESATHEDVGIKILQTLIEAIK